LNHQTDLFGLDEVLSSVEGLAGERSAMANGNSELIVRGLRTLCARTDEELTDGQLLRRFADEQNEEAFAALVRRHGPLVLGVSRRVLGNVQDAEDVFQATFLVLASRATSIRNRESLGSWLYGVAQRQALKLAAEAARLRDVQRHVPVVQNSDPAAEVEACELRRLLDEELARLPEKYRTPFVLCCLAGKTHEEAAREMGWPTGSMSRWLSRAKTMLRERLVRRGVVLTATSLSALPTEAAVSVALCSATVRTAKLFILGQAAAAGIQATRAATLARGVIQAMYITQVKTVTAALLLLAVLGMGAGAIAYRAVAGEQRDTTSSQLQPQARQARAVPDSDKVKPGDAEKEKPPVGFRNAEIVVYLSEKADLLDPPLRVNVTELETIAKLAKFFPEMDQGKTGGTPAPWKAGIALTFTRASRKPHRVNVHWDGVTWSEGSGDWKAKPGLRALVNELLRAREKQPRTAPRTSLQGVWKVLSIEHNGVKLPPADIKDLIWIIRGGFVQTGKKDQPLSNGIIDIDPSPMPKRVSGIWQLWGNSFFGIYKLESNTLTVCEGTFASPEDGPTVFAAPKGSGLRLIVLQWQGDEDSLSEKTASTQPPRKEDKPVQDGENPCYTPWQGKLGETSRFKRTCSISGGPPPGDSRIVAEQKVSYTLAKLTAEAATIDVTIDGKKQTTPITIPANFRAEHPGRPKPAGEEKVTIGEKIYRCKVYRYETRSEAEVGRDCQGLSARVTVWIAPGVAGGVVRRKIELTVKATYTVEETLATP
jgi:RNA polymerase sigma factor (sigma-70 family)